MPFACFSADLDFLDQDGGLGDAASASSYMSDAAVLMAAPGTGRNNFSTTSWAAGEDEACTTGLSASAAASVAARGVLFSNCHPAPHRWGGCFLQKRILARFCG